MQDQYKLANDLIANVRYVYRFVDRLKPILAEHPYVKFHEEDNGQLMLESISFNNYDKFILSDKGITLHPDRGEALTFFEGTFAEFLDACHKYKEEKPNA